MLLSVFGTPSALAYGGFNIVRFITQIALGDHGLLRAVFLSELTQAWNGMEAAERKTVVFFSDCPEAKLVDLFLATRAPIVVFVDNFDDVATFVSASRSMSIQHSLRLATQVHCALDRIIRHPGSLTFDAACYGLPLRAVVRKLLDFYRFPDVANRTEEIARSLIGDGPADMTMEDYLLREFPHAKAVGHGVTGLAPEDQKLVIHMARQYEGIAERHSITPIEWPGNLFLDWSAPGEFLTGSIDLVGPARFIICGPYLHLPPGKWLVQVIIELDENFSENRLGVDVFSGDILHAIAANLPAQGLYAFEMPFETTDPFCPVELRFQTLTGAIEGKLILRQVKFVRTDLDPGPVGSLYVSATDDQAPMPSQTPLLDPSPRLQDSQVIKSANHQTDDPLQ